MDAAVRGLDRGAAFAEGHHLSADLIASVPSTKIGQMISGAEAAQLLGLLKGRRPIEQTKQQAAIAAELTVQERVLLFRLASGTEGTGRRHRRDSDRNARPRLG
jgi:hypothetical protein